MTMTTELHLEYTRARVHALAGHVIAEYSIDGTDSVTVTIHGVDSDKSSVVVYKTSVRPLIDALMEVERIHLINQKTKGE